MSDSNRIEEPRELLCQICTRDYPVWYTPNELWNPVMRNPDGSDKYPFVCIDCFALAAESAGIIPTAWHLTTEQAIEAEMLRARISEMEQAWDWAVINNRSHVKGDFILKRVRKLKAQLKALLTALEGEGK